MRSTRTLIIFVGFAVLLAGCSRTTPVPSNPPKGAMPAISTDPWVLATADPSCDRGNHGIYLSNGLVGTTWGAFGADKDSRCHVAGIYNPQEQLAPIDLFQTPATTPAAGFASYRQELDMRSALLVTTVARTDGSSGKLEIFHPRHKPSLLVIRGSGVAKDAVAHQIASAWPFSRYSNADGDGVAIHGVSTDGGDTRTLIVSFQRERDFSGRSAADVARADAESAAKIGFDSLLATHKSQWGTLWERDIQIDGDPEAQSVVHKALFDLRQSVRAGGDDSVAPEGLGGDFYKGHVFWDAEIWMFPALLLQTPELARNLLDYRFRQLPEARRQATRAGYRGADFPWESARSGKETAPSGFSDGRHVTAGVGWAVLRYFDSTADRQWMKTRGWPILQGVCDFFVSRAKKRPDGYSLEKVTGPDEMQMGVDDNAYTNAMVKRVLAESATVGRKLGMTVPPSWSTVAGGMIVPFDKEKGAYLKVRQDKLGRTKQADGELLLWPAQLPMQRETADATFDLHRVRPIKNGPAMTSSIHALVASRLGRADLVESAFRESYRPFVRGPFLLFSEKRSLDRCVFLTGWGGLLDAVGYGMAGIEQEDAKAKTKATLPRDWNRLVLTGVWRQGKQFEVEATPDSLTIKPAARRAKLSTP